MKPNILFQFFKIRSAKARDSPLNERTSKVHGNIDENVRDRKQLVDEQVIKVWKIELGPR